MRSSCNARGFSLLEVVFVTGLISTISAVAVPSLLDGTDRLRTLGAVRYLSSRLHATRMEAVSRSTSTALRFVRAGASYEFGVFVDGNGDGVRTVDIERGIDWQLRQAERLSDQFSGVDFGALPGLPAPDAGGTAPGSDPLRIGVSKLLVFSPFGTATAGSLYIRGPRGTQYVIRILGETGRTRVLQFNSTRHRWSTP